MGGCATKPKVLKADESGAEAPAPAPEVAKEEVVAAPVESKEKEVVVVADEGENKTECDDTTVKEIVEGDEKPRSLSNLFQTDAGKENTETEKTAEVVTETEKPEIIVDDAPKAGESADQVATEEAAVAASTQGTQTKEACDEKVAEEEVKEIAKETSEGQKDTEAKKQEWVAEEKPKETSEAKE